ncbi:MAG: GHKL domain-containing protein [bacterium]|nr:GHKL domain-containing protein [bacterium]
MRPAANQTGASRAERRGPEPETFEVRRRYVRFSEQDAAMLSEVGGVVARHADSIVDRFYNHLVKFEPLRSLLSDDGTVERLKASQKQYLKSLFAGTYDDSYAESRLRIGAVHDRIELEPQWYLGAYGLYLDILLPYVIQCYPDDAARATRAATALGKLMILDVQVVLDAYYETRERRAVEKSEQLAAVGELAASIAHEVRNPLAGMKGALEVLRGELSVKPSNLEIVDELLAQIVRLEGLVRDLLTYARPRALSPRAFDLHELIDRVLRLYKDEADVNGITVHRVSAPGTGRIFADPQAIEQVFINLIHNSIQAMEDGGTLTVDAQSAGGFLLVSLQDTGKGILPADLKRIFQPFFTTKHRGSGLGLSIVRKLVEQHKGTVEVTSQLGHGTSVKFRIPESETD